MSPAWLAYAVVCAALGNAVLRPSADLPITPYYVAAPLAAIVLAAAQGWFRGWLLSFGAVAAYALLAGLSFGVPLSAQLAQLLKYLQLLTFFGLLRWLHGNDPYANTRLRWIVALFTTAVLAMAIVQSLTGLEIPTLVNDESHLWLNTIFYTPNDLALFLGGVLCLVLASDASLASKLVVVALISLLNMRNDAKAVLIATAILILVVALLRVSSALRIRPWTGLALFILPTAAAVASLADIEIDLVDTPFTLVELIAEPLGRILALDPYGSVGSVFDRTDALIYALQAFKSNWYLGLGPGGSVYALSLPQYELVTAKSLHNALAEVVLEFGPASLLLLGLAVPAIVTALRSRCPGAAERGRLMLLGAAPLLAVSQSSGFISNYAFWLTVYLVCRHVPARTQSRLPRRKAATPVPQAARVVSP